MKECDLPPGEESWIFLETNGGVGAYSLWRSGEACKCLCGYLLVERGQSLGSSDEALETTAAK